MTNLLDHMQTPRRIVRVAYRPEQSVPLNMSYSPSAGKPEKVMAVWEEHAKAKGITLERVPFEPASRQDLYLVHNPQYVDGVLDLKIENGFGNKLPEVARALPYVSGSMVAATLDAIKNKGVCFSPTSGAHHACYNEGELFCTFNFLALAALKAHQIHNSRVGIIDCDAHYGNGTDDIIKKLGLDFITHYSFGADPLVGDGDTPLQDYVSQDLPKIVSGFKDCDVIIYNAGADPHIDDPLGGCLTTKQLKQRDEVVLQFCKEQGIPVAISLAGGYQDNFSKVLEVHLNTFKVASKLQQERQ